MRRAGGFSLIELLVAMAVMVTVLFPLVGKADIRKRMGLLKAKVEASA